MKKIIFLLVALSCSTFSYAQAITNCKNPVGVVFYHSDKNTPGKTNFEVDEISGGMLSIHKTSKDSYDLYVVDSRKKISSMVQDGGKFILLRKGEKDATFILMFPNSSIELYTIWLDNKGMSNLDMMQSRGGDSILPIQHKSSLMLADCDAIKFELIGN